MTLINPDETKCRLVLSTRGKNWELLDMSYGMYQPEGKGMAAGPTRPDSLRISKLSGKDDNEIAVWAAEDEKKEDGSITIRLSDMTTEMKKVEFKQGFITDYSESCADQGQCIETFTIIVKELKIGDAIAKA